MASLRDLYTYYCRRCDCRPNSAFCAYLDEEYERNDCQRVLLTVDVSANYLGKNGIIPVLDLVKNIKTVEKLDVSNNRLEHEQLEHLVYCLVLHPSIHTVVLRNNCLHDGSMDHIRKLLEANSSITDLDLSGNDFLPASLALLEQCLEKNRAVKAQLREEAAELAIHRARLNDKRASYRVQLPGSISAESSGGHLHFATWWRNPQYRICVSRRARVSIAMRTAQGEATKGTVATGVAVLRFDGVRRVIDIEPRTVLAESAIDASGHCCVEVELDAADHYVVMPFTFQPGKAADFTLTATMLPDSTPTLQEEGWVTLEPLDERYDWCSATVTGAWTTGREGGGRSELPTWRGNPMFRLQYRGNQQSYFQAAPADVHLLLCKSVDPDDNDTREIGLDVVMHDPCSPGRPPLICSSELVHCSHRHERRTAIMAHLTVPSSSLDLFVVPSTREAHQAGSYTLAVFSTVPFDITASAFPHGWTHRVVSGEWNEEHCGGSLGVYASWKNNVAYKILTQDGEAGGDAKGKRSSGHPIIACLEAGPPIPIAKDTQRQPVAEVEPGSGEGSEEETDVVEKEEEPDPAETHHRSEVKAFWDRHSESAIEVCVAAVEDLPPQYPLRRSATFSTTESQLLLPDASGEYLLVPMTRHAGTLARYRLHLFSDAPFVVADSETLAERERAWQLAVYVGESEARLAQEANAAHAISDSALAAARLPALREAAEQRAVIVAQCEESKLKFSDRDFPRGTSSLWLDPAAKPPFDFPAEYSWQRVGELSSEPVVLSAGGGGDAGRPMAAPYPYNKRQWFASVVQALAAKPHWLAQIFEGYDRAHGFAQFRFFKAGKWVSVVVDDFLPVDAAGHLCMGHSTAPADYFYPLAEKAYAKLHRCYEALEPKVVPELSLTDSLAQGMEDASGGLCTRYSLRPCGTAAVELADEERNALWRKLKEASKTTALHTLLLRSDYAGAAERRHVGLLCDHLYGVMDARLVEKQRLVKLRNWQDGAETVWKGRWVAESTAWTPTLRTALQYTDSEPATATAVQSSFWLSFDEVLYYFTDLLVTELPPSRSYLEGCFKVAAPTYAEDTDVRLRTPQYALRLDQVAEGCTAVEVTIGLHREDARMSITRDKHATAKYRHALGMAVLVTHDNRRHVKRVEESQVRQLQVPVRARDVYAKVVLDPRRLSQQQVTLVPFQEHARDADTPFLLSASCAQATVSVVRVDDNFAVSETGAWEGVSAGGPPTAPTWRDNPQFFLYPSESMEVSIALTRGDATGAGAPPASVGFTVHTTRSCRSFLQFEPATVVTHAGGGRALAASAQTTVTLTGMQERRGMPYVIVPHGGEAGATGSFTLTVIGNKPMRLAAIEPRLDWHRVRHTVSLCAADGSAGGSPRYPSWRCSPQLALSFPVTRAGRVLVAAVNRNTKDDRNALGLMLLRGDGDPHVGGDRRRLLYDPADVVAASPECVGRTELTVDVGAATPTRRRSADRAATTTAASAPLILLVYTAQPFKEVDIDLAFYAETPLEVAPVREWKYTAGEEGGWELGQTAGGNRRDHASWINNPFFGLSTVRPTTVIALLVQYPRASEQPIVKRLGKQKAFLPPPITNPDRRMTIELDLVLHDDHLTPVDGTGPTRNAEAVLTARLGASGENKPFILVPAPTLADQDADYKLFVYADHPIDLFPLEKERLWYV